MGKVYQNNLFIDGSYTQTGLVLATKDKEIFLGGVSVKPTSSKIVTGKSFSNMVSGSFNITNGIRKWLSKIPRDIQDLNVFIESPYPGPFSTALYGLDFSIIHSLNEKYDLKAFSFPPSKISYLTKLKWEQTLKSIEKSMLQIF